jgi:tripartite-type tricarboxylate transporter receptor subunit TctC
MSFLHRLVGASMVACASLSVHAQQFPVKPLKMILSYSAGGPTDVVVRLYANKYGEVLGQPVVVENRPGGGGLIGIRAVAQSAPDGYTLDFSTTTHNTATVTYKEPGYALNDFTLVAPVGITGLILTAHAERPYKSLRELIAYAKANPTKVNSGTLGGGGITQLILSRFKVAAGIDTTDINYPGGGPAMQALAAGTIDFYIDAAPSALGQLKSGRVRAMAITTERRSALAPDIPTFKELGLPTMSGGAWFAAFAPAKTPAPVVQVLRGAAMKVLADKDFQQKLIGVAVDPWGGSMEEFEAYLKQDWALWEADAKKLGLVGTM